MISLRAVSTVFFNASLKSFRIYPQSAFLFSLIRHHRIPITIFGRCLYAYLVTFLWSSTLFYTEKGNMSGCAFWNLGLLSLDNGIQSTDLEFFVCTTWFSKWWLYQRPALVLALGRPVTALPWYFRCPAHSRRSANIPLMKLQKIREGTWQERKLLQKEAGGLVRQPACCQQPSLWGNWRITCKKWCHKRDCHGREVQLRWPPAYFTFLKSS